MASPVLAYADVERIVLVCRVDPADTAALNAASIGRTARQIIVEGFAKARRPVPVTLAEAGDEAIVDPAGLVVLIHANAAADPARPAQAAIAVAMRRPGQVSDAIPLFLAPPVAVDQGGADVTSGMQRALRALLLPTVVEPMMSMPGMR